MKNTFSFLKIIFVSCTIVIIGCEIETGNMNQEAIIGTWISADKSDTLDFVNNESFYKSNEVMRYDHYDYELFGDAIKIRYSGKLYILVSPTVHSFNLSENKLTIDFSNEQCYGFNQEKVDYFKNE